MDHKKLKIIHGLEIFLGKTYGTEKFKHLLFLQKKIISIRKILMRIGKIKKMKNLNKIFWV